jgi:transcriptional regulator with XRE-family HTH domain
MTTKPSSEYYPITTKLVRAAEFAKNIGTSASRLSTYASGQVVPSATMLVRIEF